mmetsp:Transcript_35094/g.57282  ORF Transcript_35094/g.57282 Transcript_35094/m.57282 type:complete len:123 (-) Transcript_35094:86-454(-)
MDHPPSSYEKKVSMKHPRRRSQNASTEHKNAEDWCETLLKRQLDDAFEEIAQSKALIESLREQENLHGQTTEESRQEWLERTHWYEERWEEMVNHNHGGREEEEDADRHRCAFLQKRPSNSD